MPAPKPGDDGYTKINCLAAAVPALLATLVYALPRMWWDDRKARRAARR